MKHLRIVVGFVMAICGCSTSDAGRNELVAEQTQAVTSACNDPRELTKIQNYLATRVDPATIIHSYTASTGDIVDCVDINRQPGLRRASGGYNPVTLTPPPPANSRLVALQQPLFAGGLDSNGHLRSCPPMTVPIRRVTQAMMCNYPTFAAYFTKVAPPDPTDVPGFGHAEYDMSQFPTGNFHGIGSEVSVWQPTMGTTQAAHSIAQVWAIGGDKLSSVQTAMRQSAEVGWLLSPQYYGDVNNPQPHFFIFYTASNYSSLGTNECYDADCVAFVVSSPGANVMIGGPILTQIAGQEEFLSFRFEMDSSNNWALTADFADGTPWVLGYYPQSVYLGGVMSTHADDIRWGGEVYDSDNAFILGSGVTAMGNGVSVNSPQFATPTCSTVAMHDAMQYKTTSWQAPNNTVATKFSTDLACWNASSLFTTSLPTGACFNQGSAPILTAPYFFYTGSSKCN